MNNKIRKGLLKLLFYFRRKVAHEALPLRSESFIPFAKSIRYVDVLSDSDLSELNEILRWNCFVVDSKSRRFGSEAWNGKRNEPQLIPDRRIQLMDDYFDLSSKHVLEVGCFEGVHTIGLTAFARRVTAVDVRIENVVKTIVRLGMFGVCADVFKYDLDDEAAIDTEVLRADVLHHVGVFYHLKNPVGHLASIGSYIRDGVMLDTHYARDDEANEVYEVRGQRYRYKRALEYGHKDVFSGVHDHSKWLRLDDIISLLSSTGFEEAKIVEKRSERNGERVLLFARRKS